jgi:cation diffusion facilitator family transporter
MGGGLTFAAAAVELLGGWRTGSAAVAAEGLHMGAHVSAFLLAGLGYVLARRLRAAGRAGAAAWTPDAAAFGNGLILLGMGAGLGVGSAAALHRPEPVAFWPALGLAAFGLAINLISVALLSHAHAHEPGHGRDMNFRAVYLHILGDAAVGVLAVLGLVLGRSFGWRWTDPFAGALGALLLIVLGMQVMVRSASYLREARRGEVVAVPPGAAARRPRVAPHDPIR